MGSDQRSSPERNLQALAAGEVSVLERLTQMQVDALERSKLDPETYLLVRLAALVATDAAPVSYLAHLGTYGDREVPMGKILGTLVAIAPIVGSSRVLSAASRMDQAGLIAAGVHTPLTGTV